MIALGEFVESDGRIGLSITSHGARLMNPSDNLFAILLFVGGDVFLPIVAVTVTGFAKISIVIFIVRNALGIQQLPPNIIVYGLSLILSVYISMPVMNTAYTSVRDARLTYKTLQRLRRGRREGRPSLSRPSCASTPTRPS